MTLRVSVNGREVAHREDDPPRGTPPGRRLVFVRIDETLATGDDIDCTGIPTDLDAVWVRFPYRTWNGTLSDGNLRFPSGPRVRRSVGPSMGSAVDHDQIGLPRPPRPGAASEAPPVEPDGRWFVASSVPAPPCDVCGARLEALDPRNWTCRDSACPKADVPVPAHESGVYPARSLP